MNTRIIFITFILLASCNATRFSNYPGTKLDAFPQEVQGEYAIASSTFSFQLFRKKDTAIMAIRANGIYPLGETSDEPQLLSDSLVLSRIGRYYALSQRVSNNPPQWTTDIWLAERNQIYAWYFDNSKPYATEFLHALTWIPFVYKNETDGWQPFLATADVAKHLLSTNPTDSVLLFVPSDSVLIGIAEKYVSKEKPFVIKRVTKKR